MRLFFWSAKRLLPLYGVWLISFLFVAGISMLFQRYHAPEWALSGLLTAGFVFCVAASIRAIIAQARDNAAPPPDWLTGKARQKRR
jgi:apolipoprotein N-acyltransferase